MSCLNVGRPQRVDYILLFFLSLDLFFFAHFGVTRHNRCKAFIISPVISLFSFCGKALIKHLIAPTSQKCVIRLKHKKACNYSQRICPSSPLQLQKGGYHSKHVSFPFFLPSSVYRKTHTHIDTHTHHIEMHYLQLTPIWKHNLMMNNKD